MMKPFKEYRNFPECLSDMPPPRRHKYYAYKGGEAFGPFDNVNEALAISRNTETVCVNKDEIDAWKEAHRKAEDEAFNAWYTDLKAEYSYLPEKVFNLCYSKAYEDGHSSGYDEVANKMIRLADFAEEIMKVMK